MVCALHSCRGMEQEGTGAVRRPRVLVAEDDDEMRRIVAEALRRDGCEVVEVANGARLLVEVSKQFAQGGASARFDVIVTDIRMPLLQGLAVVEGLRNARCFVPVVVMTAFGDERTRDKARALGALLIDKPFRVEELRATVQRLLP